MDRFTSLFILLYSVRMRRGGEDRLCWISSRRGLFDFRSYYKVLVPHDNTYLPWRSNWLNKAPLRVAFVSWLAASDKFLTTNNLKKWHIIVVEWCCICKKNEESVGHLLLHREIIGALWTTIFTSVGLAWVMPRRVVYFFASWRAPGGRF
jgi:hypothetical protein